MEIPPQNEHADSVAQESGRPVPITASLLFRMTRPGFLVATLVGCLLGIAAAARRQASDPWLALATVILGVLAHASANVWNDYQDELNGADVANTSRLSPFTGGARFIQEAVVSAATTRKASR